jgi:sigma-E factor negative regulatory protein RseC
MQKHEAIEHTGIIQSIEGNIIKASIIVASACAKCDAKSGCGMSESQEKIIEIVDNSGKHTVGEAITITMKQTLGFRALFLGYILPFILILTSLIILLAIQDNESVAGLVSIAILIPYYFLLHIYKDKLKKAFSFTIK